MPVTNLTAAALTFLSLTAYGVSLLHRRLPLPAAVAVALALFPIMLMFALGIVAAQSHPLEYSGWIAWPVSLSSLPFTLSLYRHEASVGGSGAGALHVVSAWLLIALSSWEAEWVVNFLIHGSASWPTVAWAIIPAVALAALTIGLHRVAARWPLARHRGAYVIVAVGFAFALVIWSLVTEFSMTGDVAPLSYVPLLNPVDVVQLFVLWVLWRCWSVIRGLPSVLEAGLCVASAGVRARGTRLFVAQRVAACERLHQWLQVPWSLSGMLQSTITQTSLVDLLGKPRARQRCCSRPANPHRPIWFAGAALLAAVIAKLFLVDLSSVGSIERIVSVRRRRRCSCW